MHLLINLLVTFAFSRLNLASASPVASSNGFEKRQRREYEDAADFMRRGGLRNGDCMMYPLQFTRKPHGHLPYGHLPYDDREDSFYSSHSPIPLDQWKAELRAVGKLDYEDEKEEGLEDELEDNFADDEAGAFDEDDVEDEYDRDQKRKGVEITNTALHDSKNVFDPQVHIDNDLIDVIAQMQSAEEASEKEENE